MNIQKASIDKLCRWYFIHSALYYEHDTSVLPDSTFDGICKRLLTEFKDIPDKYRESPWKIDKDELIAGSGHTINFKEVNNVSMRFQMVVETLRTGIDVEGNKIDIDEWTK